MMEKLEFRPKKVLLVFWIIGVAMACLPFAGILTSACIGIKIPCQMVFAMGYLVPLVIFTTYAILFFLSIRYELDERYVTKSSGILTKKRSSIPLEKITHLDVHQGTIERIFGYGKIWIFTPSTGTATSEDRLVGIAEPHDMKQIIVERMKVPKQPQKTQAKESQGSATVETNIDKVEPTVEAKVDKIESKLETKEDMISLLLDIRDSIKHIEESLSQKKEGD